MTKSIKKVMDKQRGDKALLYCIRCKAKTNHVVVKSVQVIGHDVVDEYAVEWDDSYQIVECKGCDHVSFRRLHWDSESVTPDDNGWSEFTYPEQPRVKPVTVDAKRYDQAPRQLRRIYSETIRALNEGSLLLSAGGVRAIVDGLCAHLGIKGGTVEQVDPVTGAVSKRVSHNLDGKISGLAEHGHLSARHATSLHQHRFMGNEALHELEAPLVEELKLAVEIVEHALETIFELPAKGQALSDSISRRRQSKLNPKKP